MYKVLKKLYVQYVIYTIYSLASKNQHIGVDVVLMVIALH